MITYSDFRFGETEYSQSDLVAFNIKPDSSELTIEFKNVNDDSDCDIKCKIVEHESEITISGCTISIRTKSDRPISTYSAGFIFKFNTKTRYQFLEHHWNFYLGPNITNLLTFRIHEIFIEFTCYIRTCEINKKFQAYERNLESSDIFYPCENDDEYTLYGSVTCVPSNKYINTALTEETWRTRTILMISISFVAVVILGIACRLHYGRAKSFDIPNDEE
ncbi:hypothetical protein RF11_13013 [Thelohanellus kitauei]|uniref:ZP domain-containing protein n=1 Tax=Thelohanellus kitauei TaxID=669202 RepID=A0A0C2MBB6_THEKT|nr:hypothetical protein RF11_13013 [Thelohanellus kitauei]